MGYPDFFDQIYNFDIISSTNDYAREMIFNKKASGNFLVTAEQQTLGRGRKEKLWVSPAGGLWMTVALYSFPLEINITIFAGVMIHKAILSLYPELRGRIKLKWPNDIYLDDKKLCGILTNYLSSHNYHIIGIGINSDVVSVPDDVKDIACSMRAVLNRNIDNNRLLDEIFSGFFTELPLLINESIDKYIVYLKENSYLLNKRICLDTDFEKFRGRVIGYTKSGAIMLELENGFIQPFFSGSVVEIENG